MDQCNFEILYAFNGFLNDLTLMGFATFLSQTNVRILSSIMFVVFVHFYPKQVHGWKFANTPYTHT